MNIDSKFVFSISFSDNPEAFNYPLANEVARGYSNATVRPSFRTSVTILMNTLGSTSFNEF